MGIFKLLFGKKNKKEDTIKIQEANTEEISEIQDKNYDSESKATRAPKAKNQTKINTEKSKTATEEKIFLLRSDKWAYEAPKDLRNFVFCLTFPIRLCRIRVFRNRKRYAFTIILPSPPPPVNSNKPLFSQEFP